MRKTQTQMYKYMRKRSFKWDEWTPKRLEKFTRDIIWTKFLTNNLKLKPYIIKTMIYNITFLIKLELGDKILLNRGIKKGGREASKIIYNLIRPELKQADVFTLREIKKVILWLFTKNDKHKIAALALSICFLSGARTGDLLNTWWETTRVSNNEGDIYWHSEIRCGKNNKIPEKREQLTIRCVGKSTDQFKYIWNWYTKYCQTNKIDKGKLFKTNTTNNLTYYFKKASKRLGLTRVITGHSGRNSTLTRLFKAEINDTNINLFMRWNKDSNMLYRYRNTLLETSNVAPAYKLREFDETLFRKKKL